MAGRWLGRIMFVLAIGVACGARAQPLVTPAPGDANDRFEQALTCLGRGDARCAVDVLEGHAQTDGEMRLLIAAYRGVGDTPSLVREMQRYARRFPHAAIVPTFRRYVAEHASAPTGTSDPSSTRARGSPLERARECVQRGDQRCVVRELQGRSGAAELRLLISTYRAVRDTGSALREMRRYISRYPNDGYAPVYRQFLVVHGQ